jgi:hypothetical protein
MNSEHSLSISDICLIKSILAAGKAEKKSILCPRRKKSAIKQVLKNEAPLPSLPEINIGKSWPAKKASRPLTKIPIGLIEYTNGYILANPKLK